MRRNRRAVTPQSPRVDGVMVGRKRGNGDEANRKNRGRNIGTYPACVRQPLSFFGQTDRMLLQFVDKSVICRALLCLSPPFSFRTYSAYVPTIIVRISYNYSRYILQLQRIYPYNWMEKNGERWGKTNGFAPPFYLVGLPSGCQNLHRAAICFICSSV